MHRLQYTIQGIALQEGATYHQVAHAIRRLGIEPTGGLAGAKLYEAAVRTKVRKWLKDNARRELRKAPTVADRGLLEAARTS